MKRELFQSPQLPWAWTRQAQTRLSACLCGLSFVGNSWWLGQGDAAELLREQQVQHAQHLQSIQTLQNNMRTTQQEIARIAQTTRSSSADTLLSVMQHLKASAFALGVQLPVLVARQTFDPPHLQFEVHGRYADVWAWWQQAQAKSSALVIQQIGLQNEGNQLQITGRWLWSPIGSSTSQVQANQSPQTVPPHIGFDRVAWLQAQQRQAQQLPSYARWVTPEVNREPEILERFGLHRLRYEGMIADANKQRALIRILDAAASSQSLVLLEEGAYLGQDFGRLQAITSEHLLVREVVRDAHGEWSPRWLKLPLGRLLDTASSSKSGS